MDWSNYLVIGLLVFLVGMGVAGSLIGRFTNSNTVVVKVVKCFSLYDNVKKIITIPRTVEN